MKLGYLALSAAYPGALGDHGSRSASQQIIPASGVGPEQLAAWVCATVRGFDTIADAAALERIGRVAHALVDDALESGIPPMTLQVTVDADAAQVAVSGGRSVGHRSVAQYSPRLADARNLADGWTIRLGPGGRGSVLTASVRFVPAGRMRRLLRALAGRRR